MNDPGASRKSTNVSFCTSRVNESRVCPKRRPRSIRLRPPPPPRSEIPKLQSRLPPEVNRILYVRNLPFKISAEELYDIFGKYGAVYQIRLGDRSKDTRGTAFVGACVVGVFFFFWRRSTLPYLAICSTNEVSSSRLSLVLSLSIALVSLGEFVRLVK
jgi:hypothetical protein